MRATRFCVETESTAAEEDGYRDPMLLASCSRRPSCSASLHKSLKYVLRVEIRPRIPTRP